MTPFQLTVPSQPNQLAGLRHRLGAWLDDAGFSIRARDDAVLAVNEAAANAIEHAHPADSVTLRAEIDNRILTLEVADTGNWDGQVAKRIDGTSGRGLAIIGQLMQTVEINTNPAGTTLCMHQPF